MKSKLQIRAAVPVLFLLVASLVPVLAQSEKAAPGSVRAVDAATGLPPFSSHPAAPPDWKDSNWKDPAVVLTNVFFDNLPVAEVARNLRDQFKAYFDVLLPGDAGLQGVTINLRLKDVTASEVFNAMNLVFENDNIPIRWELVMNGHRPTALLKVLTSHSPTEPMRMVFFVGDLVGDEKSGGMTLKQLVHTILDVSKMSNVSTAGIQFHEEAQLLIVTGQEQEIGFVQQTLNALKQKVQWDKFRKESGASSPASKP